MTEFVSEIKAIPFNEDRIFNMLSDLSNLEKVKDRIPQDKIQEFEFDKDSCSFSVAPVGKITFQIVEREPYKTVKFTTANSPIPLYLWIQLKQVEEKGVVSVEGANQYALKYADLVYGLPETSSEYFISDMDIPFCQMVLYGSVPYVGVYGNLSSDYEKQLLHWLEYGYVPAFELTYSTSEVLKETNYSDLYTSQYESNKERLEKAYKLYENVLSKLNGAYMMEHTVLEKGFVKIEYSNGISIYINYTEKEKTHNGLKVAAGEYLVDMVEGD